MFGDKGRVKDLIRRRVNSKWLARFDVDINGAGGIDSAKKNPSKVRKIKEISVVGVFAVAISDCRKKFMGPYY